MGLDSGGRSACRQISAKFNSQNLYYRDLMEDLKRFYLIYHLYYSTSTYFLNKG